MAIASIRAALLAISTSLLFVGCGGSSTAPAVQTCSTTTVPMAAERAKLAHWFAGGVANKKIVWVGDSTTYLMDVQSKGGLYGLNDYYLNTYVNQPGSPLYGTTSIWMGANGNPLSWFLQNGPAGMGLSDAIAAAGDLYIFSYGINDVRDGTTSQDQLIAELKTAINAIRAQVPNADFILRMPNSFLTTDMLSYHFVTPNDAAQAYTDILRNSYRSLANEWPNVALYDQQALVFGEISLADSPLMRDQIHPNYDGYVKIFEWLVAIIGEQTPAAPGCH